MLSRRMKEGLTIGQKVPQPLAHKPLNPKSHQTPDFRNSNLVPSVLTFGEGVLSVRAG